MRNCKACKAIVIITCLFLSFTGVCFGDKEGVNPDQPISIGDRIYTTEKVSGSGNDRAVSGISYMYVGCENNSIKIQIVRAVISLHSLSEPKSPTDSISLPLNAKKQALLKVQTLNDVHPNKEILISVVDDFSRIKAEEFKE